MKKILAVDDYPDMCHLIAQSLCEEGYDARMATQSLRVLDAIREFQPDLILLDLMMPYLEGEDQLRLMKLVPEVANTPVIVVTAKVDVHKDEPTLRQLGVLHIVRKPFDLNQLLALVKQTIG